MSPKCFLALALALAACTANVEDGHFTCSAEADCPSGYTCNANGYCYRAANSPDGGVARDGGPIAEDAGPCVGADCITLIVTNAFAPSVAGVTFTIERRTVSVPAYGETTSELSVSRGGNGVLDVSFGDMHGTFDAEAGGSYAAVIAPSVADATIPFFQVLPLSFTTANPGMFTVHPIDMTQGGATYSVQVDTQTRSMTRGGALADGLVFMDHVRTPLELHVSDRTSTDVLLAAFDPDDFQYAGDFYVVFVGRPDVHLAAPRGLHAIPVVPGAHALTSAPIVFVLDASNGDIVVCDGTTLITPITIGQVAQGIPAFGPGTPSGGPRSFTIHPMADTCAGTQMRMAGLPWPTTTNPVLGRVLLAIVGDLTGSMWGPGSGIEAPPASSDAIDQVITYGNGNMHTIGVGTTADGILRHPPGPGTAFYEWPTGPTDLVVDFSGTGIAAQTFTFDWNIHSHTAALLAVDSGTGLRLVYEIDTTFGQAWQTMSVLPRVP